MAGSFYSLEEVAQILGKTEDEVRNLVQDGKIRECRDGSKRQFKKEEIDDLKNEFEPLILNDSGELELNLDEDESIPDIKEESSVIGLSDGSSIIGLSDETSTPAPAISEAKEPPIDQLDDMIQLSEADTQLGDEGLNLLADEVDELSLNDELSDTAIASAGEESEGGEDEIGRLDADVNMDSFGSGSGLLDLSLQADDTSLGAVLDDILPSAGGEEAGGAAIDEFEKMETVSEPEFGEAIEDEQASSNITEAAPMADSFGGFHEPASEETTPAAAGAAVTYVQVPEDPTNNAFGSMLFVTVLSLVFIAGSHMAASKGITTSLLLMTQNIVWMIAGGLLVAALAVLGVGYAITGKGTKKK